MNYCSRLKSNKNKKIIKYTLVIKYKYITHIKINFGDYMFLINHYYMVTQLRKVIKKVIKQKMYIVFFLNV